MNLAWMAWTWPTAIFFIAIAAILVGMTIWELVSPTVERVGVLKIPTTRGDRCFISLLGAAFIHLGWLYFVNTNLWWALGLSLVYAVCVYRWV